MPMPNSGEDCGWGSRVDWCWVFILLTIVALTSCAVNNRWSRDSWSIPLPYGGDTLGVMSYLKLEAAGEMPPLLTKYPSSLGAPFRANRNDTPTPDEGVFLWSAALVWLFGVFVGSNLSVLSAQLFAALSFYYVCRQLRSRPVFAALGAILFACSRYAFGRGLAHLTLTFYWHIPLGILVVFYCLN